MLFNRFAVEDRTLLDLCVTTRATPWGTGSILPTDRPNGPTIPVNDWAVGPKTRFVVASCPQGDALVVTHKSRGVRSFTAKRLNNTAQGCPPQAGYPGKAVRINRQTPKGFRNDIRVNFSCRVFLGRMTHRKKTLRNPFRVHCTTRFITQGSPPETGYPGLCYVTASRLGCKRCV